MDSLSLRRKDKDKDKEKDKEREEYENFEQYDSLMIHKIANVSEPVKCLFPVINFEALEDKVLYSIIGPNDTTVPATFGNIVYGRGTSVLPRTSEPEEAFCDRFGVVIYPNRYIFAIADGLVTAKSCQEASERGVEGFIKHLAKRINQIKTTAEVVEVLVQGIQMAQNSVLEGKKPEEVGSTGFLGGMILKVKSDIMSSKPFICISICLGSPKAFHLPISPKKIIDLTPLRLYRSGALGNKTSFHEAFLTFQRISHGDALFLATDGCHLNFDPEYLGKLPNELGLRISQKWSELDTDVVFELKMRYVTSILEKLTFNSIDPFYLTSQVVKHLKEVTSKTRNEIENNPQAKIPKDLRLYPGYLSTAVCLFIIVGDHRNGILELTKEVMNFSAKTGPKLNRVLTDFFQKDNTVVSPPFASSFSTSLLDAALSRSLESSSLVRSNTTPDVAHLKSLAKNIDTTQLVSLKGKETTRGRSSSGFDENPDQLDIHPYHSQHYRYNTSSSPEEEHKSPLLEGSNAEGMSSLPSTYDIGTTLSKNPGETVFELVTMLQSFLPVVKDLENRNSALVANQQEMLRINLDLQQELMTCQELCKQLANEKNALEKEVHHLKEQKRAEVK